MVEIKKSQRWAYSNLNGECRIKGHPKSKVVFEITHVYSPNSPISNGCLAKAKIVQIVKDAYFKKEEWWGLEEYELGNTRCECFQYLDGQESPKKR